MSGGFVFAWASQDFTSPAYEYGLVDVTVGSQRVSTVHDTLPSRAVTLCGVLYDVQVKLRKDYSYLKSTWSQDHPTGRWNPSTFPASPCPPVRSAGTAHTVPAQYPAQYPAQRRHPERLPAPLGCLQLRRCRPQPALRHARWPLLRCYHRVALGWCSHVLRGPPDYVQRCPVHSTQRV